jgi:hypothetical protein
VEYATSPQESPHAAELIALLRVPCECSGYSSGAQGTSMPARGPRMAVLYYSRATLGVSRRCSKSMRRSAYLGCVPKLEA